MKALVAIIALCSVLLVAFQFRELSDKNSDRSASETDRVKNTLRQNGYLD